MKSVPMFLRSQKSKNKDAAYFAVSFTISLII